jgi:anti-sigma factor RsiW
MNIKKYFHLKKSSKPVFSSEHISRWERLGEDAYVGWVLVMSVSFLTVLILIALAAQLFFLIRSGGITATQVVTSSASHASFDQKSLDGLITSFDVKASTTVALEQGYNGPPDPSQ